MKKTIVILFVCSIALGGCFYDNYTELYPAAGLAGGCDTLTPVTYNKQISVIMNGYCVSCHSTGAANGNIILDTYAGTVAAAASGKMVPSIRHQDGQPAMPPNVQLDECLIRQVELWIENNYEQ